MFHLFLQLLQFSMDSANGLQLIKIATSISPNPGMAKTIVNLNTVWITLAGLVMFNGGRDCDMQFLSSHFPVNPTRSEGLHITFAHSKRRSGKVLWPFMFVHVAAYTRQWRVNCAKACRRDSVCEEVMFAKRLCLRRGYVCEEVLL